MFSGIFGSSDEPNKRGQMKTIDDVVAYDRDGNRVDFKSSLKRYHCNVLVTPEMAQVFKEHARNNRHISQATVKKYAMQMVMHKWHGSIIYFDPEGYRVDGGHRVEAVIKAGVPVVMDIGVGFTEEEARNLDKGRAKTLRDVLMMRVPGLTCHKFQASYVSHCLLLAVGKPVPVINEDEFKEYAKPFAGGLDLAVSEFAGCKKFQNTPIAAAVAFAYRAAPSAVKHFSAGLLTGVGLQDGDPALTLRNLILGTPDETAKRRKNEDRVAMNGKIALSRKVLSACYAHVEGRKLSKVYDNASGLEFFRSAYATDSAIATLKAVASSIS